MKKKLVLSILSLGAIFVALIFSVSPTDHNRYLEEVSEEATVVANEIFPSESASLPATTEKVEENYVFYDVIRVVDGDTVKIRRDGEEETLRLIGMNTPETVDPRTTVECFGKEASDKAKEILSGKRVRLETDPSQDTFDKYGRTLGYILLEDGTMYNKWMIEHGYAYEYTYRSAYKYQKEFKSAQDYAEENELGLWSPETCSGKK